MGNIYSSENKAIIKIIKKELIKNLSKVYLEAFDDLSKHDLGNVAVAKTAQCFLLSRDGALAPLQDEEKE